VAGDEHQPEQVVSNRIVQRGVDIRNDHLLPCLQRAPELFVLALEERGDQSVLRQLLGQADVAHDPREAGDQLRRFDSPDRVDRAMGIGGRHGHRSSHEILRRLRGSG